MLLKDFNKVYFLGIGGIGMSALARWFNANGFAVAGYDKTPSSLTEELIGEGIRIHFDDDVKNIPDEFALQGKVLVVYTPAIPADHQELNFFRKNNFPLKKRAEVLGLITGDMFTVAIAGTHGKTTTSSMVAHILKSCGKDTAAFLGGITQNYQTNLLLNAENSDETVVVVEADEYDRSFLQLRPNIAIITTMDADHLDIYKDEKDFQQTFVDFSNLIEPGGILVYKDGLPVQAPQNGQEHIAFGGESSPYKAKNEKVIHGEFYFDIQTPTDLICDVRLMVPGRHNVQNALAAFIVGKKLNIPTDQLVDAIGTFKGVKRRFEYIVRTEDKIYVDDYAHHPTEVKATLGAVRALFPEKKVKAIFQPHLFSRTRDFMDDFAESFNQADELILLDIYPARELPIPGITSSALLDKVKLKSKKLCSKEEVLKEVAASDSEVIITMGAGDIDRLVQPIKEILIKS